jgi:predicted DNA-binding transcriptional regulator AlpA
MLLRFPDLADYGVHNWPTLRRWIEKRGAPRGFHLGPNTRAWYKADWDAWAEKRAQAPLEMRPKRKRAA